jgi:ribosome-associated protein
MRIHRDELLEAIERVATERFSGSGGPGGQHVNKTSSKVTLRVPLSELPLSAEEQERAAHRLSGRVNETGELIIHSSDTRSQTGNRRRAHERAADLILESIVPRKKRKPTRPTRAAKERRMESKKRRGEKKRLRKPPEGP